MIITYKDKGFYYRGIDFTASYYNAFYQAVVNPRYPKMSLYFTYYRGRNYSIRFVYSPKYTQTELDIYPYTSRTFIP